MMSATILASLIRLKGYFHFEREQDDLTDMAVILTEKLAIKSERICALHPNSDTTKSAVINGSTSDGYHTFDELYEHRNWLWINLCKHLECGAWKSWKHSDGTNIDGWFLLGMNAEKGKQITYHLPMRLWNETLFASEEKIAPKFDGHTSADVLDRLKKL